MVWLLEILPLVAALFFVCAACDKSCRATGAILLISSIVNAALYPHLKELAAGSIIDNLTKSTIIDAINAGTIMLLITSAKWFKEKIIIPQALLLMGFMFAQAMLNVDALQYMTTGAHSWWWQNFELINIALYILTGLSIMKGSANGARNIYESSISFVGRSSRPFFGIGNII